MLQITIAIKGKEANPKTKLLKSTDLGPIYGSYNGIKIYCKRKVI